MRTTVELSDALAHRVRRYMKEHNRTLRSLVEAGLERVLAEQEPEGFQLRDAAFRGDIGFAPGASAEDIPRLIREMNDRKA